MFHSVSSLEEICTILLLEKQLYNTNMQLKFLPILLLQENNKIRSYQAASHILEEVEMVMILLMIDLLICHIGNNILCYGNIIELYFSLYLFLAYLRVSFWDTEMSGHP